MATTMMFSLSDDADCDPHVAFDGVVCASCLWSATSCSWCGVWPRRWRRMRRMDCLLLVPAPLHPVWVLPFAAHSSTPQPRRRNPRHKSTQTTKLLPGCCAAVHSLRFALTLGCDSLHLGLRALLGSLSLLFPTFAFSMWCFKNGEVSHTLPKGEPGNR